MQCVRCMSHRLVGSSVRLQRPSVIVTQKATDFHHTDYGAEYSHRHKDKRISRIKSALKKGLQLLPEECEKFSSEFKGKFTENPIFGAYHGDYEVLYKFDDKETIESFYLTTDRSMLEGKTQAEFVLGPKKTGIFRGFLNTTPPKDGLIKNAGYANIRSPMKMKSFQRPVPHDLSLYSHLLLKVRGDGRPYRIQMSMDRYFDIQFHDQYSYMLFTRGGPYWQMAHIPFSKFFLGGKGRIQDEQERIQLESVLSLGITLADDVTGAFELEIDFIAAIKDERHTEEFAYEMYEVSGASLY